jgi:hypothetical protein
VVLRTKPRRSTTAIPDLLPFENMAAPMQSRNAESLPAARQSMHIPVTTSSPSMNARVTGRIVPIPEHIRPFLDTTHQPTEDGYVPNPKAGAREDVNPAGGHYFRLRRLPPVRHPATHRLLSAYSGVELKPEIRFSGHQFDEYIFHAVRQARRFMFRVEKQHTTMGYRYPRGHESTRCRFARCPIDGTIRSGQIRVCISEFADPRNEVLDPYHNAGYTHLYCLENFCNLSSLLAETDITFLPAVDLAKESSYPALLTAAEREACLHWARQARRSWRDFKNTYPAAEARPRYRPLTQDRLYYRLDQIREAQKASNKRPYRGRDGPQVYTYTPGRRAPAPEPAPKRLRPSSPSIYIPALVRRHGPQVFQAAPMLPYQTRPPTSQPRTYNNHPNPNPAVAPQAASSGQVLSGLAQNPPTQSRVNGTGALEPGAEYSYDEIGALLAQDFVTFLNSTSQEFPGDTPTDTPAAGVQENVKPEQSTQPEQAPPPVHAPRPGQDQQAVAAKMLAATSGRRRSRRSSAPPVLGASARIRKSLRASRRSSRTKRAPRGLGSWVAQRRV